MPSAPSYWLTSIKDEAESDSISVLRKLIQERRLFVFGARTPGRTKIAKGDWLCFYAAKRGIVGHARICSSMRELSDPIVRAGVRFFWAVELDSIEIYPDNSHILSPEVRVRLDAFKGKTDITMWSWFVQATRRITEHDFHILTTKA